MRKRGLVALMVNLIILGCCLPIIAQQSNRNRLLQQFKEAGCSDTLPKR